MTAPPITYIDSSLLSKATCPRRYRLTQEGYGHIDNRQAIDYVNALHRALKVFYSTGNLEEAKTQAIDYFLSKDPDGYINGDWRNLWHLTNTIEEYYRYNLIEITEKKGLKPIIVDGEPFLEKKFLNWITPHICLVGTIDMLAEYCGVTCLVDHKSTGAPDMEKFFSKFELSMQALFYNLAYTTLTGNNPLPFVVNGIFLKKVKTNRGTVATFAKSDFIHVNTDLLVEFKHWVDNMIEITLKYPNPINAPACFADCMGIFSPCSFIRICNKPFDLRTNLLETNLTKSNYDPTTFQD